MATYNTQSYLMIKSKLSSIDDFAFERGDKNFNRLSNNGAAYWRKKTKGGLGFHETSFKTAINHLIKNCYVTMKQAVGIPMGTDPALF